MTQKNVKRKTKPTRYKLSNGLEVHLYPMTRAPVVSVQMWVKTGSADERVSEQGISHFIEQLVFKGTRSFAVGEIARTVEASGGELNAWTSFDQTVFYVNLASIEAEHALHVISDMMGHPTFDSKEVDAEREVVIEEIKRTLDSPARLGSRLLFSNAYKKHPYRLPVIGRPEVIRKVSVPVLQRYFAERYSSRNMVLCVAGDFEVAEMCQKIEARFSDLPSHRVRAVKRAKDPARPAPHFKVQAADVQSAQIHLTWATPKAQHKDVPALELAASVLGQGEASRLVRALRIESDCVTSVGAGMFAPKDPGFFSVSLQLNVERLSEAMQKLEPVLREFLRQAPTAEELKRSVIAMQASELYGLETAEGQARKLGSVTTLFGDPNAFEEFLSKIEKLKPQDVHRAAKNYLRFDRMGIVALIPKPNADSDKNAKAAVREKAVKVELARFRKQLCRPAARLVQESVHHKRATKSVAREKKTAASAIKVPRLNAAQFVKAAKTMARTPWADRLEILKVPGLRARMIFVRDPSTPVLSAQFGSLGGGRIEKPEQCGLTELLSRTWVTGTADLNESELGHRIEMLAGDISAFGGRRTAGVSAVALKPFEAQIADLFFEVAFRPRISSEAVEREKKMMLESLRTRADRPGQIAMRLFMEAMFKNHPYSIDPSGTPESVPRLTFEDVSRHRETALNQNDSLLVVAGNFDPKLWADRFEKGLKSLPTKDSAFFKQRPESLDQPTQRLFHEIQKEQTQIVLGWRGVTLDDPKRFALQVAQAVLAGQGGRLFVELRDKKSLAYSVGPMSMEGVDTGYFGAQIGCSPEKTSTAIDMLLKEFDRLAQHGISDTELERAARYLIGTHDLGLQKTSAISSAILFQEIYGLPSMGVFHYADAIRAVTREEVRGLVQQLVSGPKVIVTVGHKEKK